LNWPEFLLDFLDGHVAKGVLNHFLGEHNFFTVVVCKVRLNQFFSNWSIAFKNEAGAIKQFVNRLVRQRMIDWLVAFNAVVIQMCVEKHWL